MRRPSLYFFVCLLLVLSGCQAQVGLLRPNSAVQTADGNIYVLDNGNHRIVKINAQGKMLDAFGKLGNQPDRLYRSWDLTLGPDGNFYLCNIYEDDIRVKHDEVKVFTPEGKLVREIGRNDYDSDEGAVVHKPFSLAFDQAGNLYVADYLLGTSRVFDPNGQLITTLFADLPEGQGYIGLNDIAIDAQRGLLYAVDFDGNRVDQYRLTYDGAGVPQVALSKTLATFGHSLKQIAFPQYAVVNAQTGWLYVGDTGNRRVQIYDADGNHVNSIELPDVKEWQIMGVSFGSDGNLYVTDAYNNLLWVFSPDGVLQQRVEVVP